MVGKPPKNNKGDNTMKIKEALKKFGVKNAETQIDPRTGLRLIYEPKPPTKIQAKMDQANKDFR